jgi:hypothetical protein
VREDPMRGLACLAFVFSPYRRQPTPPASRSRPKTDVIGIRIGDERSGSRVLGSPENLRSEQDKTADGADSDFPFVRLTRADGKQEARLFAHYGDIVGSYNDIEVRPAKAGGPSGKQLPSREFSTERGIKLGMRQEELVRTLGSCFRRERGKAGEAVIVYEISDPEHVLLRRANMPSYYARYAFQGGRLA